MDKKSENLYNMFEKSTDFLEVNLDNVVEAIAELMQEDFSHEELNRMTWKRGEKTIHEIFIEKYKQLIEDQYTDPRGRING